MSETPEQLAEAAPFPPIFTALSERHPHDILTVEGLATLLHCHPETIRRAVKSGELPAPFHIPGHGSAWFVEDILRHWQQHRLSVTPQKPEPPRATRRQKTTTVRQKKVSSLRVWTYGKKS